MKTEVFTYLGLKILYVPEVNYYFNVSGLNPFAPGSYEMKRDELQYIIGKCCPDASKVFRIIPYEERLDKMAFSKSKLKEKARTAEHTLCLPLAENGALHCKYGFTRKIHSDKNSLPLQTVKDAIDFLTDTYAPDAGKYAVELSGVVKTRPHLEFVKNVVCYCKEKHADTGKNMEVHFTLNDGCLTEEVVRYLEKEPILRVCIRMDEEVHRLNCMSENGEETCRNIAGGLCLFQNKKVDLAAAITPLSQNADLVYDYLSHIDAANSISMEFSQEFGGSAGDLDQMDVPFLIGGYEKLCFQIFDELKKGNFAYLQKLIQGTDYFGTSILQNLYPGINKFYKCDAGKTRIAVDSRGDIYACGAMLGEPEFEIGTLQTGIDPEKQEKFWIPVSKVSQKCRYCTVKNTCGGGCCTNGYLKHRSLYAPVDTMCKITAELARLSMAFLERLHTEYPRMYSRLMDLAFQIQGSHTADSAVWAVLTFLRHKSVHVPYSLVLETLRFTNKGVFPTDLLEFLQKYVAGLDGYILSTPEQTQKISFPAVSVINKEKASSFRYLVLLGQKDSVFLAQTPELGEERVYEIPVSQYLSQLSNVFIF